MGYLVKPVNIRNGNFAPAIACDADTKELAIQEARSKSRLSDFTNWDFYQYTKHLKSKQVKIKQYE